VVQALSIETHRIERSAGRDTSERIVTERQPSYTSTKPCPLSYRIAPRAFSHFRTENRDPLFLEML